MAAGASGSTWNDSQKDEIIRIAESAIDSITQLSNIVGRSNPAPVPAPSSVTPAVCTQKMPLNFTADFQLHVQEFLEVQGRYVLRRILLGVPLDDHANY